jgi:hypothetical protein
MLKVRQASAGTGILGNFGAEVRQERDRRGRGQSGGQRGQLESDMCRSSENVNRLSWEADDT